MLGLAVVPSVIQFFGFLFMPESPRWLIEHGHLEQGRKVLRRIRASDEHGDQEFEQIVETINDCEREKRGKSNKFALWSIMKTPHVRKALIVGCALQLFQQVSGINTVMYYSATIFRLSGIKDKSLDIWLSAVTASMNFLFTFIGLYLVEKIGRRTLTLASLLGKFNHHVNQTCIGEHF